jgi:hypothetical protein
MTTRAIALLDSHDALIEETCIRTVDAVATVRFRVIGVLFYLGTDPYEDWSATSELLIGGLSEIGVKG